MAKVSTFLMRAKKYLYFLFDLLKSNLGLLKRPYKLNFVITKNCNSKCINCNIWQVQPKGELELAEIKKIATSTPYLKWIDFTGGEPTNHPELVEIVKIFNEKCKNLLFVHFPTNGLIPEKIEGLVKEIDEIGTFKVVITVSIDGPRELNDKLRGVPGDFEKSVETFKRLKKLKGVDTYIGMTLFESNYQYIDQTFKELKAEIVDFKVSDLHINVGHHSQHYYENSNSSDINPTEKMLLELETFNKKKEFNLNPYVIIDFLYRKLLKKYIKNKTTPLKCESINSSIYISEHGKVYPCSMWDYPIESLREFDYDMDKIYQLDKTKKALELIKDNKCSHCWTPCEAYQSIMGNLVGTWVKK